MGQLRWLLFGPVLALGIACYLSYQSRPEPGAIVTTKSGKVQGIISQSRDGREFEQWLGIPYAQPPVGVLRFSVSFLSMLLHIRAWTWRASTVL